MLLQPAIRDLDTHTPGTMTFWAHEQRIVAGKHLHTYVQCCPMMSSPNKQALYRVHNKKHLTKTIDSANIIFAEC